MSRAAAGLLGLLVVAPLAAQSPAGEFRRELNRYQARADSLAAEWREVRALAQVADSLTHALPDGPLDTIAVGPLRIIANPSPLPLREAAALALPILDSLFGAATSQLTAHPWELLGYDPDTTLPPRERWAAATRVPWDMGAESLSRLLASTARMPRLDAPLRRWLKGAVLPSFDPTGDLSDAYYQLVTAPFEVNRDCFRGELDACVAALGLDAPDSAFRGRYRSNGERRRIVQLMEPYFQEPGTRAAFSTCLAGDDPACGELLTQLPGPVLPEPLSLRARQALVRMALLGGGSAAYLRLTADSTLPLEDRLGRAAGIPADSLVARWRRDILLHRPAPVALQGLEFGSGLGWILVFGLCGLASSRWRQG